MIWRIDISNAQITLKDGERSHRAGLNVFNLVRMALPLPLTIKHIHTVLFIISILIWTYVGTLL